MNYRFRNMLALMTTLLFLFACGKKEDKPHPVPIVPPQSLKTEPVPVKTREDRIEEQKDSLQLHIERSVPVLVDTRSIAGRKLGGLYSDITGIEGVVGTSYHINYGKNLVNLWIRKLDRKNVSEATIQSSDIPIQIYLEDPRKMTLKQFIAEAEREVTLIKRSLDFAAACKGYRLDANECAVFTKLAQQVRGVDLVAYGMTEIMPSAEGDLNVKIMEILLRNAGSNYMFTIPALFDRMLSLGFYQFTSYAVNGGTGQGASKMNKFLPDIVQITGSVITLRNRDHHRAAYLFALNNLANLAKKTNAKEFVALRVALKKKPGDIVTFMATAHHAPRLAIRSARHWLAKGAKDPLNNHLIGRLRAYGAKSDSNLLALEKVT